MCIYSRYFIPFDLGFDMFRLILLHNLRVFAFDIEDSDRCVSGSDSRSKMFSFRHYLLADEGDDLRCVFDFVLTS